MESLNETNEGNFHIIEGTVNIEEIPVKIVSPIIQSQNPENIPAEVKSIKVAETVHNVQVG